MWRYLKAVVRIEEPVRDGFEDIIYRMQEYTNWEVFSVNQRVISEWEVYGEKRKDVEYTLYMKRFVKPQD